MRNPDRYTGEFTFSANGMLLYQTGPSISKSQLTIYDAEGGRDRCRSVKPRHSSRRSCFHRMTSKVAVSARDPEGRSVIWVHDLSNGVGTRLTFGSLSYLDPVWSADGKKLAFDADNGSVFVQASDGSSPAQTILTDASPKSTNSWSPDGKFLALQQELDKSPDLWMLPLAGDRKPMPFISGSDMGSGGCILTQRKMVCLHVGRNRTVRGLCRAFSGTGGKLQVSSGGGQMPEWMMGGHQLAYINETHNVVLVEMNEKPRANGDRPIQVAVRWTSPAGAARL